MNLSVYQTLLTYRQTGQKALAVLIDPDKVEDMASCQRLVRMSIENRVDFFLVGGSLITRDNFGDVVRMIKRETHLPVVLFPGSNLHIESSADAILFLSLISGRNPELLIGQHVVVAPVLKRSSLEVLPTGYILIDSGGATTVSYMSNTVPIPRDKPSVAACTAMAGEMLGLKLIYLEAGSGAGQPIDSKTIRLVRKSVDTPLIVGGGIDDRYKAQRALEAGADMLVVGNATEENPALLAELADLMDGYRTDAIHRVSHPHIPSQPQRNNK